MIGADPLTIQLSAYRVALGLSQQVLAEKLGVGRPALSHWETGRTRMTLPVAAAYARAVGVSGDRRRRGRGRVMVVAKREPKPRSHEAKRPHIFAADLFGDRDWRNREPIDCLYCAFPRANAIHKASEELAPNPISSVDKRIIGEGG